MPSGTPVASHTSAGGTFTLERYRRGLYLARAIGHMDVALAKDVATGFDALFASEPKPTVFHDWFKLEGYDSDARKLLVSWLLETRKSITAVHMLVASRILAMGIAVANVALGGFIRVYTHAEEFERALVKELGAG